MHRLCTTDFLAKLRILEALDTVFASQTWCCRLYRVKSCSRLFNTQLLFPSYSTSSLPFQWNVMVLKQTKTRTWKYLDLSCQIPLITGIWKAQDSLCHFNFLHVPTYLAIWVGQQKEFLCHWQHSAQNNAEDTSQTHPHTCSAHTVGDVISPSTVSSRSLSTKANKWEGRSADRHYL